MTTPYALGPSSTSSRPPESFRDIEDSADAFTVSDTESSSTDSIYGIGYLSGKWLQSIGEAAIRVAEKAGTTWKLKNIEHVLKTKEPSQWSPSMLEALLEYQRVNFVYSDDVRRSAWDMIFIAMEKKGWKPLTQALRSWGSEYVTEERWFVQQLAICKLSGWSSHPVRAKIRNREPLQSIFKAPKDSSSRSTALTESLAHILLFFLEKNPSMIHEAFHLDSCSSLLATDVPQRPGRHIALSLFFNSFASLHPFPIVPLPDALSAELPKMLDAYPSANCLIQYLCTTPLEQREGNMNAIVNHIVCAIGPFSTKEPQQDQEKVVLWLHPYLKSPHVVNATWPFLCFAVLLTWQCADATNMLIGADIIKILEGLSHRYREKPMCLLYVALLNTMSLHHDLGKCPLKRNLEAWLAGKRRPSASKSVPVRRPGSSGSQTRPLTASPQQAAFELPRESVPTFPSRPSMDSEPPLDPYSASRRYLLADALALAQRAVDLDSRNQVEKAIVAYATSAQLLVEVMELKVEGGRVSKSARLVRDVYEAYMARINVLCLSRKIPPLHVDRPPRLPPIAPTSPLLPHGRSASVSTPVPQDVASSSQFRDTLRLRNEELLAIWRSDMIPRES